MLSKAKFPARGLKLLRKKRIDNSWYFPKLNSPQGDWNLKTSLEEHLAGIKDSFPKLNSPQGDWNIISTSTSGKISCNFPKLNSPQGDWNQQECVDVLTRYLILSKAKFPARGLKPNRNYWIAKSRLSKAKFPARGLKQGKKESEAPSPPKSFPKLNSPQGDWNIMECVWLMRSPDFPKLNSPQGDWNNQAMLV